MSAEEDGSDCDKIKPGDRVIIQGNGHPWNGYTGTFEGWIKSFARAKLGSVRIDNQEHRAGVWNESEMRKTS